jgi:hypothetical protein
MIFGQAMNGERVGDLAAASDQWDQIANRAGYAPIGQEALQSTSKWRRIQCRRVQLRSPFVGPARWTAGTVRLRFSTDTAEQHILQSAR